MPIFLVKSSGTKLFGQLVRGAWKMHLNLSKSPRPRIGLQGLGTNTKKQHLLFKSPLMLPTDQISQFEGFQSAYAANKREVLSFGCFPKSFILWMPVKINEIFGKGFIFPSCTSVSTRHNRLGKRQYWGWCGGVCIANTIMLPLNSHNRENTHTHTHRGSNFLNTGK